MGSQAFPGLLRWAPAGNVEGEQARTYGILFLW
jgi:hypothetical protein